MGIGFPDIRLHLDLYQRGCYDGFSTILDMGAQDLHINYNELEELLSAVGLRDYDNNVFLELKDFPHKRMPATEFYKLLGFKEHKLIDINNRWDSISHDLNFPMEDSSLFGRFDVVTDCGNNEHAFNVYQAYKTMHQLCKKNGILYVNQAVYGGNGYYNFNPSYFEDMAVANRYEIIYSFYVLDGNFISTDSKIEKFVDRTVDLALVYVMRKTTDDDFKTPYQGDLMASKHKVSKYQMVYLPDTKSRTFAPLSIDDIGGSLALKVIWRSIRKKLFKQ
jgi:hypothetical protein